MAGNYYPPVGLIERIDELREALEDIEHMASHVTHSRHQIAERARQALNPEESDSD